MYVLVKTKLPKSASILQKMFYPPIRTFFYFFFGYLPYAPIRRFNKPKLEAPYLWACSHSNYLCDVIPAGSEGDMPTKFLAKSTLFRFPIRGFLEFCGALPVARAEDFKGKGAEARSGQNRSTFRNAIAAMQKGWPVAIFPEGMSIVSPGLVLPLKPGVAKLAFAAEEAAEFSLNLKIIPVGLEYGSRSKVGSGLNIRYGESIHLADYKELYLRSKEEGVDALMRELTKRLVAVFPHFQNETKLTLGKKLVALGLVKNKFEAAQVFLKQDGNDEFWLQLEQRLKKFEESNRLSGVPLPAWGHRRVWKELGPLRRKKRLIFLVAGAPLILIDALNSTLPELFLSSLVENVAADETEKMSLRFIASPIVLTLLYALQFYFLKKVVFEQTMQSIGWGHFPIYCLLSFSLWYFAVQWRKQFKRVASLYFFRRAGVDGRSEIVTLYKNLRQYLSNFQNSR